MKTEQLNIKGMSCGHCVASVRKHLEKIAGVEIDEVTIGQAKVQYDETKVKRSDLTHAIEEAGYNVIG